MRHIGKFEVTSGALRVTDPCYDMETWCAGEIPALNGTWHASLEYSDEGPWGRRVANITVRHERYPNILLDKASPLDIGVDSGQAGFFDLVSYRQHEGGEHDEPNTFYGQACAATHDDAAENHPGGGIVMGFGAVASSGLGDGSYTLTYGEVDGAAVVARITFLKSDRESMVDMARLLSEIRAVCVDEFVTNLADAMSLATEDVEEMFEAAQYSWDEAKGRMNMAQRASELDREKWVVRLNHKNAEGEDLYWGGTEKEPEVVAGRAAATIFSGTFKASGRTVFGTWEQVEPAPELAA